MPIVLEVSARRRRLPKCTKMARRIATVLAFVAVVFAVTDALQSGAPPTRNSLPKRTSTALNADPLPFAITRVQKDGQDDMQDVSKMCVEVFFNEDNSSSLPRQMQLAYLRNLQYGDLRMKFFTSDAESDLFMARQVVPAAQAPSVRAKPLDVRKTKIYNAKYLDNSKDDEFVLGDVLGFVEVTEKRFRLGEQYESTGTFSEGDDERLRDVRPFLSNLSVREDARKSGVGSALVDMCEDAIQQWPRQYSEIVLQVEDENKLARKFYEKRGYTALFADPACRRFDTNGLILRRVPTTKVAMRKLLGTRRRRKQSSSPSNTPFFMDVVDNLKQLVGSK